MPTVPPIPGATRRPGRSAAPPRLPGRRRTTRRCRPAPRPAALGSGRCAATASATINDGSRSARRPMSTAAKAGRTAAIPPTSPSHRSGTAVNRVRPLTVRFEPLRRGPGLITLGSLGGPPMGGQVVQRDRRPVGREGVRRAHHHEGPRPHAEQRPGLQIRDDGRVGVDAVGQGDEVSGVHPADQRARRDADAQQLGAADETLPRREGVAHGFGKAAGRGHRPRLARLRVLPRVGRRICGQVLWTTLAELGSAQPPCPLGDAEPA